MDITNNLPEYWSKTDKEIIEYLENNGIEIIYIPFALVQGKHGKGKVDIRELYGKMNRGEFASGKPY